MTFHPQYVVDRKGRRRNVILSLREYRELLESAQDVIDADLIEETRQDRRVPWSEVKAKRRSGRRP